MSSVSGLSYDHRIEARDRVMIAAELGLRRASSLSYTQDAADRWDGITRELNAKMGECPRTADCSSFATWCLWNGLHIPFHVRDTVNGASWRYGYTGSMVNHGKRVLHRENWLRADLVLYGDPFGRSGHVAVYVGGGKVISFGGDPGPRLLPADYRPIAQVRRYI
jgi:cell wall-associated NlpC family hydrolase